MTRIKAPGRVKTTLSLRAFNALFPDERAARLWFESARWPEGVTCPRCGAIHRASWMESRSRWSCKDCALQYSVMSFTVMHRSHLPLLVWAQAIYWTVTSSKGVSSLKLSETLGISYKAAWFLTHRIREMMAADLEAWAPLLKGLVEIDETYMGAPPRKTSAQTIDIAHHQDDDHNDHTPSPPSGGSSRAPARATGRGTRRPMVLVAVERAGDDANTGRARAWPLATHSRAAIADTLAGVLDEHAVVATDGLPAYRHLGQVYGGAHAHHTVVHSQRVFARVDEATGVRVHVHTAESWFAMLQRAVIGVYHHVSSQHLARHANEAAFRWSTRNRHALDRMRGLVQAGAGAWLTFKNRVGASA